MTGAVRRRLVGAGPFLVLAALAYVPLLLTAPGRVGADTKTYLYLDPGRLLSRAPYMWDPTIGLGTVTHQNIGYLFPMGPFYWLLDAVGLPDWVAQRLWLGSILFAAGAGVLFLLRTFDWPIGWRTDDCRTATEGTAGAALVAALAYMLTPYVLPTAARLSVILLPWAGLPWLIALAARALRQGGWRHPALFALTVLLIGGVNATSLVFAGVGPLLWFPFAVWVTREAPLRRALGAMARIGGLTLLTSLWWIAGLIVQGNYGIEILRYTEAAAVVARTSLAPEVLRGLGYWFFYGGDRLGPWIEPGSAYTQRLWLLAVTYAVPVLALVGAALGRWRHRAYFAALVLVGTFLAVGAHPWNDPTPAGRVVKAVLLSDVGLALRSTPRAAPLLVLGFAVLLGAGVSALGRAVPRLAVPVAVGVGVLVAAGMPPLWTGGMVAGNLDRSEDVPGYWREAAAHLDQQGDTTRVLEIPGIDFASYRWGNTVDPITPGLMDRPYVARELIPYGSPPSADLLNALDRRLQEGVLDPEALAPVARFMGVGDVVVRSDLQFERYRTPRPRLLWDLVRHAPGLGPPVGFGGNEPNVAVPEAPLLDELELATAPNLPDPPRVAVLPVEDPVPIVRARPAEHPVLMAGDGEGLVEAAAAGLVTGHELVRYSASFANRPAEWGAVLEQEPWLVLTDSNRRRGRRWTTVKDNVGYTERAGEALQNSRQRMPVFPDAGDDARTVAEHRGGVSARASGYGNRVSFTPEHRPANAADGDPLTAWKVGARADVAGERLRLAFDEPVTTDVVTLLQPQEGVRNRFITDAVLRFDGADEVPVELGLESRELPGQEVRFGERTFRRLEVEIRDTDIGRRSSYPGIGPVGFAEVRVDDRRLDEVVRLPTDMLNAASARSVDHPLTVLFARSRTAPTETVRSDEEVALARTFSLPVGRAFGLAGTARLSARADDSTLDRLMGLAPADQGGVTAESSARLPGDRTARASSAIDGDPATAWSPGFGDQVGQWVQYQTAAPVTFDRLDLAVVADSRHSVPTRLRLEADGRPVATVAVPEVDDQDEPDASTTVSVPVPPTTASSLRVVIEAVREVTTIEWYSTAPVTMPVGIAELGLPGLAVAPPSGVLDPSCRTGLVTVNGDEVAVRVLGSVADALAGEGLDLEPCPGGESLTLDAGDHLVRSRPGRDTGLDVDRLVLHSDAGGRAAAPRVLGDAGPSGVGGPAAEVTADGRTSIDVTVTGADEPFWLVLGQSHNDGWSASAGDSDLGPPQLVDGYANGWLVDPEEATVEVSMRWTPQRLVWVALGLSVAGVALCTGLAVFGPRRSPPRHHVRALDPLPAPARLRTVLAYPGAPPAGSLTVAVVVAAAVLFGALSGLVAGLVTGVVTLIALRLRRSRPLVALGAPALLGLCGLYVVAHQLRYRSPPGFEWPTELERIHVVGWLAVAFLVVDVVATRLWTRSDE